jgi:hypothetical protein
VVVALVIVAAGVATATWPLSGRTVEEWAPDAARHAAAVSGGRRRRGNPFAGVHLVRVDIAGERHAAHGLTPNDPVGGDRAMPCAGILHDRPRRTFTAVFEASDPGFVLLGESDKSRRVAAWSGVLASLAREASNIHRVQWIERFAQAAQRPDRFAPAKDPSSNGGGAVAESYGALIDGEPRWARRHQVLITLTVSGAKAGRAIKAAGGGDQGACALLLREVAALRRRLGDASIDVGPVLDPEALHHIVRSSYQARVPADPGAKPATHATPGAHPWPWPMGAETRWGSLRTDDTWHATYWIAEWPRRDVGPDFLGPLLLLSDVDRTVSVVMEPLGPLHAARRVEQARTADIADAELRRRGGFLATARRSREQDVLARREVEMADGHAPYRFSGYVTVTATDPCALDDACQRIEQSSGSAGLELRRCFGDQLHAFLCTLPLGRGLC